ncbi:MAG: ORF6N domain-containing protein [Chitinophagales bacterium]|nr:ORF6N domain-containing protein [Chitinophagales bacterium]
MIPLISEELIANRIYVVRNQKVMLDRDLAELYEVETKRLKEAVRRNIDRFPEDFMFEMNDTELENWRYQFGSSNSEDENLRSQIASSSSVNKNLDQSKDTNWGGLRYKPFCFTEQGVAMLSSVLNSERAIKVNIQIIRLFTKMREIILNNKEILLKLEKLEYKSIKNEDNIERIFDIVEQLLNEPTPIRNPIGFKQA